jgi:hypothetical protein
MSDLRISSDENTLFNRCHIVGNENVLEAHLSHVLWCLLTICELHHSMIDSGGDQLYWKRQRHQISHFTLFLIAAKGASLIVAHRSPVEGCSMKRKWIQRIRAKNKLRYDTKAKKWTMKGVLLEKQKWNDSRPCTSRSKPRWSSRPCF